MATCRTCGMQIEVPEGWSVGPAVRRHYWDAHPDRMLQTQQDRKAEKLMPRDADGGASS